MAVAANPRCASRLRRPCRMSSRSVCMVVFPARRRLARYYVARDRGVRRASMNSDLPTMAADLIHAPAPPIAPPRHLAAVCDALRPALRLWRAVGRARAVPGGPRAQRTADRPAAHAHPGGRYPHLPRDHHASGPPGTSAHAHRRRAADDRAPASCSRRRANLVGAAARRDDRRRQPKRPGGGTVPADRAGRALSRGDRSNQNRSLCVVHPDGLGRDRARGAVGWRRHALLAGGGDVAGRQLPRGRHRATRRWAWCWRRSSPGCRTRPRRRPCLRTQPAATTITGLSGLDRSRTT